MNERRILVHDLDCPRRSAAYGAPGIGRENGARDCRGAKRMFDLSRLWPARRAKSPKGQCGAAMAKAAVRFRIASECLSDRGANRRVAHDSNLDSAHPTLELE